LVNSLHALGDTDQTAEAWPRPQLLAQLDNFLLQLDTARAARSKT